MGATCTGRVIIVTPHSHSGPAPVVSLPSGWTVERIAADDVLARPGPPRVTDRDLVVVRDAPAVGVRIASATGARLLLTEDTERQILLPRPGEVSERSVALPGVARDRHDLEPVLTCLVCRSPHKDALRVFSDDGRSSRTLEVVLDTGDPLGLRDGVATFQPAPTPWVEPAQVVADGGGTVEAVIDAGPTTRARRLRITPDAFLVRLIDRV